MTDVRLIDANALKGKREWFDCHECGDECDIEFVKWDDIEKAPTIDAAPVVHGRWDKPVEHGLPYAANHLGVVCSYCCKWSDNDYNYCPNCGAKMDGGASDGSD